jgi:ferrous-iron efflux pump FieF
MAIGIAVFLCISAWAVGKKAFEELMDQHLPEVELQIQELVQSSPGGAGCHDVRCRQSGPNIFIQFHLEIDRKLPLWSAHEIGDRIENGIKEIYPTADIIVHLDPVTIE